MIKYVCDDVEKALDEILVVQHVLEEEIRKVDRV